MTYMKKINIFFLIIFFLNFNLFANETHCKEILMSFSIRFKLDHKLLEINGAIDAAANVFLTNFLLFNIIKIVLLYSILKLEI